MRLDLKRLYVVYTPSKHSTKVDIFNGRPTSLGSLFLQVLGGLKIEGIQAVYTTKSEADKYANKLYKKAVKFFKGLSGPEIKKGQGYAIFMSYVPASEKYKVHSKPTIYPTRKEAEKAMAEAVKKQGFKRGELKILKY